MNRNREYNSDIDPVMKVIENARQKFGRGNN
jgi:hypothetical protein